MDIHAGLGVAVREYPLTWSEGAEVRSGFADYLLYADGWAIGVIEAKRAGHTLQGVSPQSEKYAKGLDKRVPARYRPPPFAYESTGAVTHRQHNPRQDRTCSQQEPFTSDLLQD